MFRKFVVIAAVGLVGASECRAQFVDEFDGEVLAPHWGLTLGLVHNVAGGILTVTDLPFPSNPKLPFNFATMSTTFAPVSDDFFARAIVGWEPGSGRLLRWSLGGHGAVMFSDGTISVISGSDIIAHVPSAASGMHEFALSRTGVTMHAYLNGGVLASFEANNLGPVSGMLLEFVDLTPLNGIEPMYVDLVEVVPAPGTAGFLFVALAVGLGRRR